jgi:hypothetical protein
MMDEGGWRGEVLLITKKPILAKEKGPPLSGP